MNFIEKLKACYKIMFHNKPISTLTFGVNVTRCDECEYKRNIEACNPHHEEVMD